MARFIVRTEITNPANNCDRIINQGLIGQAEQSTQTMSYAAALIVLARVRIACAMFGLYEGFAPASWIERADAAPLCMDH